jgi:hypothetical protein
MLEIEVLPAGTGLSHLATLMATNCSSEFSGSLNLSSNIFSLDVLTLDADQQTLSVHLWSHGMHHWTTTMSYLTRLLQEEFTFKQSFSFKHPDKVYNVVPGDFTHSGKLDLLVMGPGRNSGTLNMRLYPALPGEGFGAVLLCIYRICDSDADSRCRTFHIHTIIDTLPTDTH